MVGPIRSNAAQSVGGVRGSGGQGGTKAGKAMTKVAGKVAASMGSALDLIDADGRGGGSGGSGFQGDEDLYEIGDTAKALTAELGGNGADEGQIARSLSAFATESASLIGARPDGQSFERIARSIALSESETRLPISGETVATVLAMIDQAAQHVAAKPKR